MEKEPRLARQEHKKNRSLEDPRKELLVAAERAEGGLAARHAAPVAPALGADLVRAAERGGVCGLLSKRRRPSEMSPSRCRRLEDVA